MARTKTRVILKRYLALSEERQAGIRVGERKVTPTLKDIAEEAGIHYTMMIRFANNQMTRIHLTTLDKIIGALHSMGHHVTIGDLLEYQETQEIK